MSENSGSSTSLWMATAQMPAAAALAEDLQVDVCVVGAGIAGLTTAYLLVKEGRSVAVLEDRGLCAGQTQRTTAHLANAIDDRYVEIERIHGEDGARLAAESHTAAIARIERIAHAEDIACDFERLDGYLFLGPDQERELLERELAAAHRAGLADVRMLERAPLDAFDTGPCLRFPEQGQFHPLKYLSGLATVIVRHGGRLFTHTHVEHIAGGSPAKVRVRGGFIVQANSVVVATNSPINDLVVMHTKQAAYISYVVGLRVPLGSVPRMLLWDTLDPYHYVRTQPTDNGDDILIVGGEDHKTGQAKDGDARYARLEQWARQRFPMAGEVAYRWSGQVMETVDGLAFIGSNPLDTPNIYVATGDSGMGMTHGTIAGILLTDLIMGRENPWAALYDPRRKRIRAAGEFMRENLNVAGQYGKWLTGGDVSSPDQVPPDSGAIVRRGLGKVAVYRDPGGVVHEMSAVCTHLGCQVEWNESEKTWDCPCHGSRFDCHGHVVQGPANQDLSLKEAKREEIQA